MAANKVLKFGPTAVVVQPTITNFINPGTATAGVGFTSTNPYIILRHLRVVNKTASPANFAMWLGATGGSAAGTEVIAGGNATATLGISVAANSFFEWFGMLRMESADFLTMTTNTTLTLVVNGEGEIGIA